MLIHPSTTSMGPQRTTASTGMSDHPHTAEVVLPSARSLCRAARVCKHQLCCRTGPGLRLRPESSAPAAKVQACPERSFYLCCVLFLSFFCKIIFKVSIQNGGSR